MHVCCVFNKIIVIIIIIVNQYRTHKCRYCINANVELVDKFCYLRDMLSVDGDADAAAETRFQIGWNKFRQLVPVLTNKDTSLIVRGRLYMIVRGRLYSSCV